MFVKNDRVKTTNRIPTSGRYISKGCEGVVSSISTDGYVNVKFKGHAWIRRVSIYELEKVKS